MSTFPNICVYIWWDINRIGIKYHNLILRAAPCCRRPPLLICKFMNWCWLPKSMNQKTATSMEFLWTVYPFGVHFVAHKSGLSSRKKSLLNQWTNKWKHKWNSYEKCVLFGLMLWLFGCRFFTFSGSGPRFGGEGRPGSEQNAKRKKHIQKRSPKMRHVW